MPLPAIRGTQLLARATILIKAVATRPQQGWRLTDLAAFCAIDKGTAHRMLAGLVRERLVQQREADKHYLPGPLLFELGLGVTQRSAFQARCTALLSRLARESQGVAFMYLLSGEEFVCAVRVGSTTLKGMSVEVGTRRPLLVSAGGVAMLLALPPAEQRHVISANFRQIESFGLERRKAVQKMLNRSRRAGYGLNLADVVPGIHAIGVPVFDASARVFASLSIAMPEHAVQGVRVNAIARLLQDAAQAVGLPLP